MDGYIMYLTNSYQKASYYLQKKASYSARFLMFLSVFSVMTFLLFIRSTNALFGGVIGLLFLVISIIGMRNGQLELAQNGMIGLLFSDAMIHLNNVEMFHYYGLLVVLLFSSAIICTKQYQRAMVYCGVLWGVGMRLLLTQSGDFIAVRGLDKAHEHIYVAVSLIVILFLSRYIDQKIEASIAEREQYEQEGIAPRNLGKASKLPEVYLNESPYVQRQADRILALMKFVYAYAIVMFAVTVALSGDIGMVLLEVIMSTAAMAAAYLVWQKGYKDYAILMTACFGVAFVSLIFNDPYHIRFYMQLMVVLLAIYLGFSQRIQYIIMTLIIVPIAFSRIWRDSTFMLHNLATVVMTIVIIGVLLYYMKRIFEWEYHAKKA